MGVAWQAVPASVAVVTALMAAMFRMVVISTAASDLPADPSTTTTPVGGARVINA